MAQEQTTHGTGITRHDIYTVPEGFFDAEKQRLAALARGPWRIRRQRRHRLIWGGAATMAAAAAIACLIVVRPAETMRTPAPQPAAAIAQASSAGENAMYLDMPQEMIDNDLFMNTY